MKMITLLKVQLLPKRLQRNMTTMTTTKGITMIMTSTFATLMEHGDAVDVHRVPFRGPGWFTKPFQIR